MKADALRLRSGGELVKHGQSQASSASQYYHFLAVAR